MTNILQSLFIAVLTPVAKFTCKINSRIRSICIHITCLLFPLYFFFFYVYLKHHELFPHFLRYHNGRHVLGCALLLLLILFSLDRVPKKVKWNKWIMYPMLISGIWMMAISFVHPVGDGYRAFALMLIIAYPCLFFVWNNRGDYDNLFTPLSRAVALIGVLYFASCFALAANGDMTILNGRCEGQLHDANLFSMIGATAACGALYLLVKDRLSTWGFIFYSIALGTGLAITLMGQSRISAMVCFINILIALFFYIRYSEKSKCVVVLLKIICVIFFVFNMWMLSSLCIDVQKSAEPQVNAVATTVETEQETTTPPAEETQSTTVFERFFVDKNATLDTYTAGRYHIWKGYAQFLNLTGNDFSKSDWNALTLMTVKHAHNNFLEMAYRFGVPLGIIFLLIEVFACIKALQYLFLNRQKMIVLLFPIMFTVMFLFESMFDIATLPFERDAPFYFYIALVPMVDLSLKFKAKT